MLDLFLFRNEKNVLVKFNFHWDYLGKLIWNQPLGTLKQQSNDSLIYLPDLANVKLWLWQIAFNTMDTICYSFLAESYTIVLPPNVIWTQVMHQLKHIKLGSEWKRESSLLSENYCASIINIIVNCIFSFSK